MGDFTEIIEGLWMGGQQVPTQPTGFDAVVNCKEINDFALIGVPCVHLPMIDGPLLPGVWLIQAGARFAGLARTANMKVLVHCAEGHNRSGLVVAYYLSQVMLYAYSPQGAIDLIRSKRPGALSNPVFVNFLLSR